MSARQEMPCSGTADATIGPVLLQEPLPSTLPWTTDIPSPISNSAQLAPGPQLTLQTSSQATIAQPTTQASPVTVITPPTIQNPPVLAQPPAQPSSVTGVVTAPILNLPVIVQPATNVQASPITAQSTAQATTGSTLLNTQPTTAVGRQEFIFSDTTTALAGFGTFTTGLKLRRLSDRRWIYQTLIELDEVYFTELMASV